LHSVATTDAGKPFRAEAMKTFHCNRCDNLVFFENIQCEQCGALLGYVPELGEISAFDAITTDTGTGSAAAQWTSLHPAAQGERYRPCRNYALEHVCNWMIPAADEAELCSACQLTRTIPDLDVGDNRLYWYRLETAKRRLLYTLSALGLPVASRLADPEHGLQFDFLASTGDDAPVTMGHADGIVTLNVAEADDAYREQTRAALGEQYRTLLGHFRHEVGHYYFDRLIAGTHWLPRFRRLFGDERADYGEAIERHYAQGAPADWSQQFVSAYATMHPWEDWAETWAHYLHMVDTLDTAASCGLVLVPQTRHEPMLTDRTPIEEASFDDLMKRWFPLTYVLNSLNRSLGQRDGYPFALASAVIDKLRFVHRVVSQAGGKR
jgi:hypothetical protein